MIEGTKYHPDYMITRIKKFLTGFYYGVVESKLFENKFSTILKTVEIKVNPNIDTFGYFSTRVWNGIKKGNLSYDSKLLKYQNINGVTLHSFKLFYQKTILLPMYRKMLTLVVHGHGKETELNVDCNIAYDRIDATKTELESACSL